MIKLSTIPDAEEPSLILVVEDDLLVAMDLAAMLTEAGFAVLGPVSTVAAALHLLVREYPDAAVLDVGLRNELVTPLARDLQTMGVPFLVVSGYSYAALLNDELLSSAPAVEKPIRPSALVDTLAALLGEASQAVPNTSGSDMFLAQQSPSGHAARAA